MRWGRSSLAGVLLGGALLGPLAGTALAQELARSEGGPISLEGRAITVRLVPVTTARKLPDATPSGQLFLVLDDMTTERDGASGYDVYFNHPMDRPFSREDTSFIGTMNFFDIPPRVPSRLVRSVSLLLKDGMKLWDASGMAWVTLTAHADPVPNTGAQIGGVRLVRVD